MSRPGREILGLAALFAASGTAHFVAPRVFESIVPHRLPAKRKLVYMSGVAELACAAGLLAAPTRRPTGLVSAVLLAAVWPANVQMAVDAWHGHSPTRKVVTLLRLPLQLPLMRTAWRASRS